MAILRQMQSTKLDDPKLGAAVDVLKEAASIQRVIRDPGNPEELVKSNLMK